MSSPSGSAADVVAQTGEVVVRLPQALAEHAGGARALSLDVGPAATLGDVLELLGRTTPAVGRRILDETGAIRRFVNVYVGDDECRTLDGLGTPVPPGTVVHVIGSVAGG
jgi:sulfur-carrier protein